VKEHVEMADDGNAQAAQPNEPTEAPPPFEYETWLDTQPAHIQQGVEAHTSGLKSALDSERSARKDLTKQLRELTSKADKGSDAEKQLTEMTSRLEVAEQRAHFFEEAGRPEIGCSNPRVAFQVAAAEGLFTKRGDPDWPAIKAAAPELFNRDPSRTRTPPGNAGAGAGQPPPTAQSMNDWIRRAAGRG
jgi:hypothetical protein